MKATGGGWWAAEVPSAGHGQDYAFQFEGGAPELPDPRSRWQPNGVHGRSRLFDHSSLTWTDSGWRGVPLAGSVLYELHVGTFTREGTFDAAAGRLGHLANLGIDAVELMPVHAFPGRHGWGYDGVGLFAVHEPYGGPEGLARFVDAAHAHGIGVIMDVVYNHLGPDGNYLATFGPYFNDTHITPWGPAVNLDGHRSDEVRAFIVENALMWLRDFHCDGLRLDAVHALADSRAIHLLEELTGAVRALAAQQRRTLFVIAESELNDPRTVTPVEGGGHGVDGQWCDDVHHALWAALSGERQGYYCDFGSLATLAYALEHAFVHDGRYSAFRGRRHGRPIPLTIPPYRFVASLQDHDQVGNRAAGDRASATLSDDLLRVGAALLLTSPFTPMLFMGEEWAATTPWQYFTDHVSADIGEAVRSGRRSEFAEHGWRPEDIPDPQDEATFRRSTLDWSELGEPRHTAMLEWYRTLVALRRSVPELTDTSWSSVRCTYDEDKRWLVMHRGATDGSARTSSQGTRVGGAGATAAGTGGRVALVCNLSEERRAIPVGGSPVTILAASKPGFTFGRGHVAIDGTSAALARLL
jgi:maltooligosyltrehalose trehalohydrolase